MRSAHVSIRARDVDPGTAFDRIRDFSRYPEFTDVVRSVTVRQVSPLEESSDWEVYFRNGILRWTETDRFDHDGRAIGFEQTDGDFAELTGGWLVTADGPDSLIAFRTEFDFGIPSLAGILDPVAERVFKETIARVVISLFDDAAVEGDEAVARAVAAVAAGVS
ncbi:type II toxin-antitoxin system RatA family toxin [Streptacidiphilus sp. ASG 303]|uniref:type II toxin-antitoxin system RatA family toxin n=1 Tax=Streptomycetaceae TaxID=2062 RepID=UPI001E628588|nr:SRPBCC family protein [Streptacidiphilus sp. ASG 303]MCD0484728.1 SRPBCC family protein [Streptacidiphilus sp. ASG 303]